MDHPPHCRFLHGGHDQHQARVPGTRPGAVAGGYVGDRWRAAGHTQTLEGVEVRSHGTWGLPIVFPANHHVLSHADGGLALVGLVIHMLL